MVRGGRAAWKGRKDSARRGVERAAVWSRAPMEQRATGDGISVIAVALIQE
jgi:hypothetical protein